LLDAADWQLSAIMQTSRLCKLPAVLSVGYARGVAL
jgi:hypothetical protein